MKILFLDIDGVVNKAGTTERFNGVLGIEPKLAKIVRRIIADTGCEVVLSSSWRLQKDLAEHVKTAVCNYIDMTPNLGGKTDRGCEVEAWLKANPGVTKFAILDDSSDFHRGQPLFKTRWDTGITNEIADQVIKQLK